MTDQANMNPAEADDTMQTDSGRQPETFVIDSHTISVDRAELAWSQADEPDLSVRRSWRAVSVIAATFTVCSATAVAAVLWLTTTHSTPGQPAQPQPTHVAPPPISVAPPQSVDVPVPPFNGLIPDAQLKVPPPAPAPAAPSGPCYFSPATPQCPPKGLTPEQRENW